MKVDREKQIIVIDEYLEEVTVEELQVGSILYFIYCLTADDDSFSFVGTTSITPTSFYRLFVQNGPRR